MITERMRAVRDESTLDALMDDPTAKAEALAALSARMGVTYAPPTTGSALVGLGANEVVKCMAPHDAAHLATERTCLQALRGVLPVPTPEIVEEGDWEGWPYVRMTRLEGEPLDQAWDRLQPADRLAVATQIGELLAILHATPAPEAIERVDWNAWRDERVANVEAVQRTKGCPEPLLVGLQAVLEAADTHAGEVGWLHTEVMRQHLFVRETSSGWRLSGLIDFEPSWVGPLHYEYASVGVFVARGDAGILTEVLRAAGQDPSSERLFAMAMLHRYANLGWYHRRLGGPTTAAALPAAWFAHR